MKTPVRAPKANAIAEPFVHTVRSECLDWLLIVVRRQLEHVLRAYTNQYNRGRPHRALDLQWLEAVQSVSGEGEAAVLDLFEGETGARIGFVSVTARTR